MPTLTDPIIMREIIMDHYNDPLNKTTPKNPESFKNIRMDSTSCIDDITIYLKTENNTKKFRIMGPVDAPISFLRGQYRKRFLIHCKNDVSMQKLISIWLNDIKIPSQIKLKIDIDPYNFM